MQLSHRSLGLQVRLSPFLGVYPQAKHAPYPLQIQGLPVAALRPFAASRVDLNRVILLEAFGVTADDAVRCLNDTGAGTVVIDQETRRGRVILSKTFDVLIVGIAPSVDVLVIIAHRQNAQTPFFFGFAPGQRTHESVLQVIDVLVLVDQDVAVAAHQLFAQVVLAFYLTLALEQFDGLSHHLGQTSLLDRFPPLEAGTGQTHRHAVIGHHVDPEGIGAY
ncbi:hypothetical protein FQZ97_658730 [compost metagenome]